MAKEIVSARENGVNPLNSVSVRTRAYGNDVQTAIVRRGADLRRRYGNGTGLVTDNVNNRNTIRINNAVRRMFLGTKR